MEAKLTYTYSWITTEEELIKVAAEQLLTAPVISIDTETSGWQTGNEKLCLIQIGVPEKKHVYLVDVVQLGEPKALKEVLLSLKTQIIAHNASFEERQFARYGMKVKGVRDTLSMSRALRPDLPNHTLRTCCRLLLGKQISKTEQTSDWSIRPLSNEQIHYAALDAEVALDLYFNLIALEDRVNRDMQESVPELMAEYIQLSQQRYELTAGISHEVAFFSARLDKVKEVIRQKLIDGAPAYEGALGKASVTKVKRTEISPVLMREKFPEFADDVIQEWVDRKRFEAVSTERGLPKSAMEMVLETVGFNERMSFQVNDETGTSE